MFGKTHPRINGSSCSYRCRLPLIGLHLSSIVIDYLLSPFDYILSVANILKQTCFQFYICLLTRMVYNPQEIVHALIGKYNNNLNLIPYYRAYRRRPCIGAGAFIRIKAPWRLYKALFSIFVNCLYRCKK